MANSALSGWLIAWLKAPSCIAALVLCASFATSANPSSSSVQELIEQSKQLQNSANMAESERVARQALLIAKDKGISPDLFHAWMRLAGIGFGHNDYPSTWRHLNEAKAVADQLQDPVLAAQSTHQFARYYRFQSDYQKALALHRDALAQFQALGDSDGMRKSYNGIGNVLDLIGHIPEAIEAHRKALQLSKDLNNLSGIADALYSIGILNTALRDFEEALKYFEESLRLDTQLGEQNQIAYSTLRVGETYKHLGDWQTAESYLLKAINIFESLGAKRDIDWANTNLAMLYVDSGRAELALPLLRQARENSSARGSKQLLGQIHRYLAKAYFDLKELALARAEIDKAIANTQELERFEQTGRLKGLKSDILEAQGDYASALQEVREQLALERQVLDKTRLTALAEAQGEAQLVRQTLELEVTQRDKALAEQQARQARWQRDAAIAAILVIGLLTFLLVGRFQQRRLNATLRREVEAQTSELQKAYQLVEQASLSDPLTGLKNRRFIEKTIQADIELSQRAYSDHLHKSAPRPQDMDMVFFLVDIDDFKQVNDRFGHQSGDQVLLQFSDILQKVFRHSDYVARWGGEEFLIVSRHISRHDAKLLAQRLCEEVATHPFAIAEQRELKKTCSVGYAAFPMLTSAPMQTTWQCTLDVADLCLYAAKLSGKNGWVGLTQVPESVPLQCNQEDPLTLLKQAVVAGHVPVEHSFDSTGSLQWKIQATVHPMRQPA